MPDLAALPLVLASGSPRRRELLARAGVRFEVRVPDVPEERAPGEAPEAFALRVALAKARAVARRVGPAPPRVVLAADTIVALGDDVLGKPRDAHEALSHLRRLAGRRHRVLTAVAVVDSRRLVARHALVESGVTLRAAGVDELAAYVASGEPMDKAGAYAAQGEGRRLISRIEGSETNVIGLPLDESLALLRAAGALPAPPGGAPGARLAALRARIARAAARAGRREEEVTLVGVAKRKGADAVAGAVRGGLGAVGENYLQEAAAKIPDVAAYLAAAGCAAPRWHFVGRLQRNKARRAAALFDVVETVDSPELGAELDRRAAAAGRRLAVLFQVDLCDEPQKGGVAPAALGALIEASGAWAALDPIGLMAIPAAVRDPEASRPAFARLRELLASAPSLPRGPRLRELSMGMSGDFEVAIEEGATIVRVGTALFGERSRTD